MLKKKYQKFISIKKITFFGHGCKRVYINILPKDITHNGADLEFILFAADIIFYFFFYLEATELEIWRWSNCDTKNPSMPQFHVTLCAPIF